MNKLKTSLALALLVMSGRVEAATEATATEAAIDKMIERATANCTTISCVRALTEQIWEEENERLLQLRREQQANAEARRAAAYEALPQAEKDRLAREKAAQDEKNVARYQAEQRRIAKQQAEVKQREAEEAEKERIIVAEARKREALHIRNRDMVGAQKRDLESSLETLRTQYHELEALYKQHPENEVLGRDMFELRKSTALGQSLLDRIQRTYLQLSEPLLIDYLTPQAQKLAILKAQEEEIDAQRRELGAYLHSQAERPGASLGERTDNTIQLKSQEEETAAPTGVGWRRIRVR